MGAHFGINDLDILSNGQRIGLHVDGEATGATGHAASFNFMDGS